MRLALASVNACEIFEILARATWRTIGRTHRNRIAFGEDAITSHNLDVLSSTTFGVAVEDTRVNEATKGCDFELWVRSAPLGWSRYAVQAKKLSMPTASYLKLKHRVGTQYQIDILSIYAKANRALPLYCFYNHSSSSVPWHCFLSPPEHQQLGCSVTPLHVVRQALSTPGGRKFSWIHQQPETLPWRCLVGCPHCLGATWPCPRIGWLAHNQYSYDKLPESLQTLYESRDPQALWDAQDIYSHETPFRPRWVAVVDSREEKKHEE